jgi:hypothetical protein
MAGAGFSCRLSGNFTDYFNFTNYFFKKIITFAPSNHLKPEKHDEIKI